MVFLFRVRKEMGNIRKNASAQYGHYSKNLGWVFSGEDNALSMLNTNNWWPQINRLT